MYGIIGNPLEHSWSPAYFAKKFEQLGIRATYEKFPLKDIGQFPELLQQHPKLQGLNITIPYKEKIIPYLNELSPAAAKIQSVNCVQIINGKTIGHNTDVTGFGTSLDHFLPANFSSKAFILGTGGASKAVAAVLKSRKIDFQFVSRRKQPKTLLYEDINAAVIQSHLLIINTTPSGMWPETETAPEIPYNLVTKHHFLFDLIYNPEETLFLKKGKLQGASTVNGLEMLIGQAEASWRIWTMQR